MNGVMSLGRESPGPPDHKLVVVALQAVHSGPPQRIGGANQTKPPRAPNERPQECPITAVLMILPCNVLAPATMAAPVQLAPTSCQPRLPAFNQKASSMNNLMGLHS